jgi:hypothetical protein
MQPRRTGNRFHSHCPLVFPYRYIAERLAVYLPVTSINRAAERIRVLRCLNDQVITLNLRDSTVFTLVKKRGAG